MFNISNVAKYVSTAVASLISMGRGHGMTAATLIDSFGEINPSRTYGPRVITHKNIGRSHGCTLRRMTKAEIEALPLMERNKGEKGANRIFLTHEHRRRYTPHVGKKELARHSRR